MTEYAAEAERLAQLCECGHTLGEHSVREPYRCMEHVTPTGWANKFPPCFCGQFRPQAGRTLT